MKKIIIYGLLSVIFTIQLVGCSNMKSEKEEIVVRECTKTLEESNDNIKMIAYNWLDDTNKESIINMEKAKVEEVLREEQYFAAVNEDEVGVNGEIVYRVTFNTVCDEILGPIVIYLNKDNLSILGMDIRK